MAWPCLIDTSSLSWAWTVKEQQNMGSRHSFAGKGKDFLAGEWPRLRAKADGFSLHCGPPGGAEIELRLPYFGQRGSTMQEVRAWLLEPKKLGSDLACFLCSVILGEAWPCSELLFMSLLRGSTHSTRLLRLLGGLNETCMNRLWKACGRCSVNTNSLSVP